MSEQADVLRAVIISLCAFFGSAIVAATVMLKSKAKFILPEMSFGHFVFFIVSYVLLFVGIAVGRWESVGEGLNFSTLLSFGTMLINAVVIWSILRRVK